MALGLLFFCDISDARVQSPHPPLVKGGKEQDQTVQGPIYFISPDGKPDNQGTKESPWDIASALEGEHKVEPGATIYLRGGVYKRRPNDHFNVRLVGTEENPIHVRPFPGERATIDGGMYILSPTAYLWMWELEFIVSEPNPVDPVEPGSHPETFTRPHGGVDIRGSRECKFINLVIHHCRGGFGFWSDDINSKIHGCIIYDNGWWGADRGHGHAIYTQNKEGIKIISDCIMTGGYSYTMHAYGSSRAYVDNFLIEGNIAYDGGPFLVGGGRPSKNIRVLNNYLYNVGMRIGYDAPHNEDCTIHDNVITNLGLEIKNYREGDVRNNLIVNGDIRAINSDNVVKEENQVVTTNDLQSKGHLVVLRPNKYDLNRANLVIYNWDRALTVQIDISSFLKNGEKYALKDPKHFFGDPVHWGVCEKGKIMIPMFRKEFAAFVMLKNGK
jgi:hypothetical protein